MISFIDEHRVKYGVEPICKQLPIAPSTYYEHKSREANPDRASDRRKRDQWLEVEIQRVWDENKQVYGVRKVWRQLKRENIEAARCTVSRPADLVNRQFTAMRPNQLWVADITYIPTGRGFLFLAVVLDVWSRRIVGWALETHLRTTLVLAALDMAVEQRQPQAVMHHSDQGCQYTALAFGARCRQAGVRPSMGSVGDCYDNALCESFFATLECELLDRFTFPTPLNARAAVFDFIEGWYNTQRRHAALAYDSPLHFEQRHRPQAMPKAPMEAAGPVDAKNASTSPLENGLRPFSTAPTGDTPALQDTM